jgi:hypothetical protein
MISDPEMTDGFFWKPEDFNVSESPAQTKKMLTEMTPQMMALLATNLVLVEAWEGDLSDQNVDYSGRAAQYFEAFKKRQESINSSPGSA